MRLGRPKIALILTDEERVRLDSLAHRSRTAPHLARRARIVLACAEVTDNKVVAKRLRIRRPPCVNGVAAFLATVSTGSMTNRGQERRGASAMSRSNR